MKNSKSKQNLKQIDPSKTKIQTVRTSFRIPVRVQEELKTILKRKNAVAKIKNTTAISMNSLMVHGLINFIGRAQRGL